ncbi:MAG TPA: VOC family protein [Stellaceae bacterium]
MTAGRITGIDHTLVGVRDLEDARMAWTRLGFALSPRGRHIGWGTANYCVMFPHDYIELLGIVDPAQFTNNLDRFLAEREGLIGVAFASEDAAAAAAALAARGLHPGEPRDLARQLELPEGTVLPRFKLTHLPPEETPGLSAFVVQHLTPELLRRRPWLDHANGAVGLVSMTVVVENTRLLADAYERLFGAASIVPTDDVLTVHIGRRHRLVFADADDFSALYHDFGVDLDGVKLPYPASMTIAVSDLDKTADHLASWQVDHESFGGVAILVPPEEANGVLLQFVADAAAGRGIR